MRHVTCFSLHKLIYILAPYAAPLPSKRPPRHLLITNLILWHRTVISTVLTSFNCCSRILLMIPWCCCTISRLSVSSTRTVTLSLCLCLSRLCLLLIYSNLIYTQRNRPNDLMDLRRFFRRPSYHERVTRTGHSQTWEPNSSISNPNESSLEGWECMAEYLSQVGYSSVDWPSYRMLCLEHSYSRVLPSAPPTLPHSLSGPQPLHGFLSLVDYQPGSLGVLLVLLIFFLV